MIEQYITILMAVVLTIACIFVSIMVVWAIRLVAKDFKEKKE